MIWIIGITAFLGSLLTLFSGFGLGTLLTPVFGLFFPIHIAVALTGIVHLLNNLFKWSLLGKHADRGMIYRFGLPSIIGGALGAWLLTRLSDLPVLHSWYWGSRLCEVTPLKLVIAVLIVFFTFMELLPALKNLTFSGKHLTAGGLLSGFFGGLSGNQGALRTAFLIKTGLDKNAFIATGVAIACLVDLTRLPVYFSRFHSADLYAQWQVLAIASGCAFAGAWIGARYLKKITFTAIQYFTAAMMVIFGVLLGIGVV
jgi:uncharacterized membrane protein YfcA